VRLRRLDAEPRLALRDRDSRAADLVDDLAVSFASLWSKISAARIAGLDA
jgi:hypothetical protein